MLQSGVMGWNGREWSGVNVLKAKIFPHVDSEDPESFLTCIQVSYIYIT